MVGTQSLSQFIEHHYQKGEALRLDRFIEKALYAEPDGYYCAQRERIGRSPNTDFYTAPSLGRVFRKLLVAACQSCFPHLSEDSLLIEVGPEGEPWPPEGKLPYRGPISLKRNQELSKIHGGHQEIILFANEILDAQPFRRFRSTGKSWEEAFLIPHSPETHDWEYTFQPAEEKLPFPQCPEGYVVDWPQAAEEVLRNWLETPWAGGMVLFDYGKSTQELFTACPEGTGRAYFQHQSRNNLLTNPGQQDITAHVWWDPLIDILKEYQFESIQLESQESFFLTKATKTVESIVTANPGKFDPERQTLKELIHPSIMGQRFQVLHGYRRA